MRDRFKRENADTTFGGLVRYIMTKYKNLTPEEKGTWDAPALQDKVRYEEEMANYVPPPTSQESWTPQANAACVI
jgi:HMG (high mobility group) box